MYERCEVLTFTPWSIGSLLIMSINGGLARGVPVVNRSPSIILPYTLVESQRLHKGKEDKRTDINTYLLFLTNSELCILADNLVPLVIIEARSKRNPSTCISVTQYLLQKRKSMTFKTLDYRIRGFPWKQIMSK